MSKYYRLEVGDVLEFLHRKDMVFRENASHILLRGACVCVCVHFVFTHIIMYMSQKTRVCMHFRLYIYTCVYEHARGVSIQHGGSTLHF